MELHCERPICPAGCIHTKIRLVYTPNPDYTEANWNKKFFGVPEAVKYSSAIRQQPIPLYVCLYLALCSLSDAILLLLPLKVWNETIIKAHDIFYKSIKIVHKILFFCDISEYYIAANRVIISRARATSRLAAEGCSSSLIFLELLYGRARPCKNTPRAPRHSSSQTHTVHTHTACNNKYRKWPLKYCLLRRQMSWYSQITNTHCEWRAREEYIQI